MSQSLQILMQIKQALVDAGLVGGQVTESARVLRRYRHYPAIGIFRLDDAPAGDVAPVGFEMRQLSCELRILQDDAVAETAVDALHAQVHRIVMSLRLGVLTVSGGVSFDTAEENPDLGVIRAQYHINYRRQEGDL